MDLNERPMWTCPRCRHRFVTRNIYHSCGRYRIADHFAHVDPAVKKLYRTLRQMVGGLGPVTVYAQKTRIVFQARARFVGVAPKKRWLDGTLWLKRKAPDPRFHRIEFIPRRDYIHHFRLTDPQQLDTELAQYLREAYRVGCQME